MLGSINFTVPQRDILFILLLDLLIIAAVFRYFEEFKAIAFDEEFARVSAESRVL